MHAEMVNDDNDPPDSVRGLTAQKITRIVLARAGGGWEKCRLPRERTR